MQGKAVQYSIRGVPREVDRLLRERASRRHFSLNRLVVDELTLTRMTTGHAEKADFSDLVGKWTPDAAFDKIVKSQRRIDRSEWK